jgi:hypothetical protein
MKAPTTYAEWLECFDKVKTGINDSEVLDCMQKGQFTMSAGVAGRFAEQLNDTIQFRIKKASDRFSRSMQMAGGDLNVVINSLLCVRKEFKFLIEIAKLPVLPVDNSEALVAALKQQADVMQQSLEVTSIKTDRTGVLTSIIRKNRLNNLEAK